MIKLTKDTINKNQIKKLADWLMTDPKLTKGDLTIEFEKSWSIWQDVKYSTFVNSGSSANLLMASALMESGRLRNNKIVVPAVSWATTVAPFMQLGYTPLLCDSDSNNLGVSIEHLKEIIERDSPAALIIVHVLGWSNSMDEILQLCRKHNVILLEDCCEAHGCTYKNVKVGNFGLMSSFSFYYGHHMSTIEGGMVCTNDKTMKNLNVMHRSHGWVRDLDPEDQDFFVKKHNIEKFNALYFFVEPGFNLRSTEINAHLGLQQLKNLDENIEKRRKAASVYQKKLKDKIWLQSAEFCNPSPLAFGIVHKNRNKIASNLIDNGIECRPLICGSIARHPFWKNRYGESTSTPNADKIHDHGMYLPCHNDMSEEIIENICDIILMSV